ncbi:MAG: aldose 1-epimerase [Limnobaculum xujianqingii]
MTMVLDNNPYMAVRQAFDAPWAGPRGPKVVLSKGAIKAVIYPEDGCRLTSLNAFGYELLRQWNPQRRAFQYGCFPMIPWVGRMGNAQLEFEGQRYSLPMNKTPHALHGMACFAPWKIIETSADSATFSFKLEHPWPWRGEVIQHFELQEDALLVSLIVKTENESFPAAAGWHPWFAKWTGDTEYVKQAQPGHEDDELQVSFNADWQEEPGDNELPTGKRIEPQPGPWDDCFGFNNGMSATLLWPGKLQLNMSSAAPSMVVFNKQPDAACVEPLSGPPNSVNTAPTIVTMDKPLVIETRWDMSIV